MIKRERKYPGQDKATNVKFLSAFTHALHAKWLESECPVDELKIADELVVSAGTQLNVEMDKGSKRLWSTLETEFQRAIKIRARSRIRVMALEPHLFGSSAAADGGVRMRGK